MLSFAFSVCVTLSQLSFKVLGSDCSSELWSAVFGPKEALSSVIYKVSMETNLLYEDEIKL